MNSFGSFEFNALDNSGLNFCGNDIFPGHNFFALNVVLLGLGTTADTLKEEKNWSLTKHLVLGKLLCNY